MKNTEVIFKIQDVTGGSINYRLFIDGDELDLYGFNTKEFAGISEPLESNKFHRIKIITSKRKWFRKIDHITIFIIFVPESDNPIYCSDILVSSSGVITNSFNQIKKLKK